MNSSREEFEVQINHLTNVLHALEERLSEINVRLAANPEDAQMRKQQRQQNLDIRITKNELEDLQLKMEASKRVAS